MNPILWRRVIRTTTLFVAAALLVVGAAACAETNSGGCNACPQADLPITAAQCEAAGKAAGCETAELVAVTGNDGLAACGAGVAYQACNWTNCTGHMNPCMPNDTP